MRPAEAFSTVLAKYGQEVTVYRSGQADGAVCRAFLQPILERQGRQDVPTVLGTVCRDRWLYLGDPLIPVDDLDDGYVRWKGENFDVVRVQPIYVGDVLSHWWAVLKLRDEA